jgi:Tfp pilus assembly protein PilN
MLIEINLAPGAAAAKAGGRRLPSLSLPSLPSVGGSLGIVGGVAAGALVLGLLGFGYWQLGDQQRSLESRIEAQATDSIRFAATIALLESLNARQDTITRKISLIRSVDTRRYVWPHLLDEISLAVPAFTWISSINSVEVADSTQVGPSFTIQGNAGSTQALTRFMKNLEASPYVRDVMLVTTEQEDVEGRTIQRFSLEASYREPDPALIETYPILAFE